jgi:hypothetical protein
VPEYEHLTAEQAEKKWPDLPELPGEADRWFVAFDSTDGCLAATPYTSEAREDSAIDFDAHLRDLTDTAAMRLRAEAARA